VNDFSHFYLHKINSGQKDESRAVQVHLSGEGLLSKGAIFTSLFSSNEPDENLDTLFKAVLRIIVSILSRLISEAGRNQSFGGRAVCRPVAESSTLRKRIFAGVTSTISPSRMNSIARSKVIGIIGVNTTFSSFPEAR